jgi:hypothetical protein
MANEKISPQWLRCTTNGSDKVYCGCRLPDGRWVTGYGAYSATNGGSWTVYDRAKGDSKMREKTGSHGYVTMKAGEVPATYRTGMMDAIRKQGFPNAAYNGVQIELDPTQPQNQTTAEQTPIKTAPKRMARTSNIGVWI